jgi:hypothetical protein
MATRTRQKRYNRRDIDSILEAATAGGFVIDREPAPFGNRCYRVAGGMVTRVGNWTAANETCS